MDFGLNSEFLGIRFVPACSVAHNLLHLQAALKSLISLIEMSPSLENCDCFKIP